MSKYSESSEVDTNPMCPEDYRVRHVTQRPMEVDASCPKYNMSRKKRQAIVFNHNEFEIQELRKLPRRGTENDVIRLKDVLSKFQFLVTVHEDSTKKEIREKLEEIKNTDFNEYDCLAIFVMSHGKENYLAAKDDFYHPDELWEPLSATACPSLAGKPKLVFINACRGNTVDQGVEFHRDLTTDGQQNYPSSDYQLVYSIPNKADIFIAYSTFDGHVSYRQPTGSWFIQNLCDVLIDENFKRKDIKTIMTRVTNNVALLQESNWICNKQVPVTVSTLMRDLYLYSE